jgi:phosphoribosyl-ATP pyrophosphohydrolase/phosphoribosyl-AMP cyclohydrolase/histidinol dehydrogenase
MTAVTARAAGVQQVWVASPRPTPITLAAAAVSGADGLIAIGGAQAIATLAFGTDTVPRCDMVVGPGNRWVTAAKQLLAGEVGIDMLAGPSELLIIADHTAAPALIAADLLAQAEHDSDAVPMLLCTSGELIAQVELELRQQLRSLPTAATAIAALANGFAIQVPDLATATSLSDIIAPEHLEIMTADSASVAAQCNHHGGIFIGPQSAEVFGDYAVGPNHVLPTGRTARFASGLSVLTFLKVRTWIEMNTASPSEQHVTDATQLARLEGLEAHARAAEARRK